MPSAVPVPAGEQKGPPALRVRQARWRAAALFLLIAALYGSSLVIPDPSLSWAAEDEACCHVPTITAIQRRGLVAALDDPTGYRSATLPLYHLVMSVAYGRVDPTLIRIAWVLVALVVGYLLYRHVREDRALKRGERAAIALAIAFLASPTVRASAVHFVTDGLAVHLAILALVALRRAGANTRFSRTWGLMAVVVAFASFYTRQYYLWVTLYVAHSVVIAARDWQSRLTAGGVAILLALPALAVFTIWRGLVPPLGTPLHTQPAFLSTAPNALALLAVYGLPLLWIALQDMRLRLSREPRATFIRRAVWLLAALVLCIGGALALGFGIPRAGGMLRLLGGLGWPGHVIFLALSYGGLLLLLRWVITDGVRQVWWGAFLLPLLTGEILLQRYFEPAILVILFLVARPRDAVTVLDSRLVWFYPVLTGAYAMTRALYFM